MLPTPPEDRGAVTLFRNPHAASPCWTEAKTEAYAEMQREAGYEVQTFYPATPPDEGLRDSLRRIEGFLTRAERELVGIAATTCVVDAAELLQAVVDTIDTRLLNNDQKGEGSDGTE